MPICNRVMTFTHVRNLSDYVSTQYFENELMEFDNMLHMH